MNETAKRAKTLLDKKLAEESSLFSRFRKKSGSSSADEFFSGLVEGAFLLAAADGDLSEDEEMTLSETLREITGNMYEPEEFMEMLHAFEEALREDGREARLKTLAGSVPDEAARRAVLSFAVLVALCDRHLADAEWTALLEMGAAFGVAKDSVEALVNEAKQGLELAGRLRRSAPSPRTNDPEVRWVVGHARAEQGQRWDPLRHFLLARGGQRGVKKGSAVQ